MKGKRSVWRVADTAVHHEGLGPREGGRGKLETGKGAEGGVRKHQSQARGASKDGQRGGGGGAWSTPQGGFPLWCVCRQDCRWGQVSSLVWETMKAFAVSKSQAEPIKLLIGDCVFLPKTISHSST